MLIVELRIPQVFINFAESPVNLFKIASLCQIKLIFEYVFRLSVVYTTAKNGRAKPNRKKKSNIC